MIKRPRVLQYLLTRLCLLSVVLFLLFSLASSLVSLNNNRAHAATSSNLNFQGRLLNASGNTVPDGNYNLEFKLYNVDTAGTALWTETRDYPGTDDRVRTVNGYFSVNLGSVNALPDINWDQNLWLSMNVGGSTTTPSWDGEMSPRIKLTAVPYALQAKKAEKLTKLSGGNTGLLDFLTLTANRNIYLPDASGTVVLDTTAANSLFVQNGNSFGGLAVLGTNDLNGLAFETNGTEAMRIDTAGNLGIGVTNPNEKLQVNGAVNLGNTFNANAGTIRWTGLDFQGYDGAQWLSLTPSSSSSLVVDAGAGITKVKSGDESVINSATLQNDDELFFPIAANEARTFRFVVHANTATNANLQFAVTAPAGSTCAVAIMGVSSGNGNVACGVGITVSGTSSDSVYEVTGSVSNGATAGDIYLQWTQGTARNSTTTVYARSFVYSTSTTEAATDKFQQGGNAFGATGVLGTTDNNALNFITNNTTVLSLATNGLATFNGAVTTSGALTANGALTVSSGGASISGGLNLNSGGITNAGNITGVGANITAAAGLTIASSGSNNLTLNSGSGLAVLGATTLQTTDNLVLNLQKATDTLLTLQNSGTGIANLNLADGGLQTAGTSRLTNGGVLQNITGLTVASGGANITGNITLGGSSSDRLTINGQILGSNALVFQGLTDNAFTTTLAIADPTANNTITLPNASGTLVLNTRNILTSAGSGLAGGGNLGADINLSLDVNGLSTITTTANSDYIAVYDSNTSSVKKVSRSDFLQGVIGALVYRGTWDASTNTPTLSDATGASGETYAVATGGTQDLGSGSITFGAGDFAIHNGTRWELAPSSSDVSSVFGRAGAITAQSGDYTALQITNSAAGNIAATTVQAALNELDTEKLGSLNGLSVNSQTFANDTNITITSAGSTHTLGWSGQLSVGRGGTGGSTFISNGLLYGNGTGALQTTAAGTSGQLLVASSTGVPTFVSMSGDATINDAGAITIAANSIALGTDTSGNYIASLGALTGLTTSGNTGEGSTPTLSVVYGTTTNSAVQGNTTLVCSSGSGNLTGGGNTITLGSGGTCNGLSTVNNPSFTTSVTTPLLTSTAGLSITSGGTSNITLDSASGTLVLAGNDTALQRVAAGAYTIDLSDAGTTTLTLTNSGLGVADLNLAEGGLQIAGTSVLTSGGVLQNVTANTSILTSGLLSSARGGTGIDGSAAANGQLLIGNGSGYSLTTIANNGGVTITNGAGSIGLAVNYGSVTNTAVQGSVTVVCPTGTGDLSGGGTSITLGTGGTCSSITISEAPVFDTSVTTPLLTSSGLMTIQTQATIGADDIVFQTAGTEKLRLLENGQLVFGTDTNLYRSAANTLKTDDNFLVQTATDSANALQVQNAAGSTVLNVATNSAQVVKITKDASQAQLAFEVAGDQPYHSAVFNASRARGTLAAPTAVLNDDSLFSINGVGHDGSAYYGSVNIGFKASGNWTTSSRPTAITFSTHGADNALNPTERMRLDANGNLGIGTDNPQYAIDVSSAGGGIRLTRTSGSEPFIYLSTPTVGSGGQIRGLDAGGLRFTNYGSNTEYARFSASGNFGIGDTVPSTRLSLGGTGTANGITFGDDAVDPVNLYRSAANTLKTDGSLEVGGNWKGSVVVNSKPAEGSNATYTEAGKGLAYYLSSNSGTTNASITTTFNITGLSNTEGSYAFIYSSAGKDTTTLTQTKTTSIQINGQPIGNINSSTSSQLVAASQNEAYIVMYINGSWRVMGYGATTANGAEGGTFDTVDFAEWIPYSGAVKPQPGEVLTVGDVDVSAKRSDRPYDSGLIGVVSTSPYQTAGADDGHSVIIALTGRVPVKVSLENGPIARGDYLTSSSTPGVAMKATKPGNIIGTALSSYNGAEPDARVTVQLRNGYADPTNGGLTLLTGQSLTVSGDTFTDLTGNGNFNNLTVNGVLEAGTIRADRIEGLDYIGRFESLEERVSYLEQEPNQNNQKQTQPQQIDLDKNLEFGKEVTISGQTDVQNLTVNLGLVAKGSLEIVGPSTFKEAVLFEKNTQFNGEVNVLNYANLQGLTVNLDLIVKGSLQLDGPATFKEAVRFEADAEFAGNVSVKGQTTFNGDTAGYATITKGETMLEIKFKNPKENIPIITLSLGEGKFAQYSYRNVTEEGFEIVLFKPADEDLNFSWIAIQTEQIAREEEEQLD